MLSKTIIGICVLLVSVSQLAAQVRVEGWHIYPELRKCPERVKANETFEVTVALPSVWTKEQVSQIKFDWKLSAGSITDGQGTEKITVNPGADAHYFEVNVEMKGPMFPNVVERCSVAVDPLPTAVLYEEFRFHNLEYLQMMLDHLFAELNNNPSSQGFIMTYPETDRQYPQIERVIKNWTRVRRFDARTTIVRGEKNSKSMIQFWIVPPGAENPKPGLQNRNDKL